MEHNKAIFWLTLVGMICLTIAFCGFCALADPEKTVPVINALAQLF